MTRRTIVRPLAQAEMDEAIAWYAEQSEKTAARFADALQAGLTALADRPCQYPVVYGHVRRCNIPGFPYGLFYRLARHEIVVLSCFHGRRNPRQWRNR